MENLFQTPVLGAIFEWWQWILILVLIALIVAYFQLRKRQI